MLTDIARDFPVFHSRAVVSNLDVDGECQCQGDRACIRRRAIRDVFRTRRAKGETEMRIMQKERALGGIGSFANPCTESYSDSEESIKFQLIGNLNPRDGSVRTDNT